MNRRRFLNTIGFVNMALSSHSALANIFVKDIACGVVERAPSSHRFGVSDSVREITAEQEMSQWCWAACVSALFAFYGYSVSQREVYEAYVEFFLPSLRTIPDPLDLPMFGSLALTTLVSRPWNDDAGNSFVAKAEVLADHTTQDYAQNRLCQTLDELESNHPLIIGSRGHIMILTSITVTRRDHDLFDLSDFTVVDPWPGRGRRLLSEAEAEHVDYLSKIRVVPSKD